ncbi:phosphatase PAP2 family protein [Maribacter halichondriae]|uniref:phosphatase PAP2 family protein n=1 Tax=Maribacter halichondriae TaxID=2980554 RepID=UPI0023585554|nr:phosphatase PAP2 family protein [Maribacter sp. Hal144]
MLEELIKYDKELFVFLNNLGNPTWDAFWMFITNKFSSIPLYLILLMLAYRELGLKKTILLVVTVAVLVLVTDQLSNFFKYGLQRLRPCYDPDVNSVMRLVKDTCGGKFGYFSAHAANSFAIAFFFTKLLSQKFRYIGIFLMVWAVLMAYSRIYIGVHFPLDVITGGLFGLVLSWIATKLYIFALQKFPQ